MKMVETHVSRLGLKVAKEWIWATSKRASAIV